MKNFKSKKSIILIVAVVLVLAALVGSFSLAMFSEKTDGTTNTLKQATYQPKIEEEFDGFEKTSIKVTNDGNAAGYVRVKLVTYWQDEEGNVVGASAPAMAPVITDAWLDGGNNVYYLKAPLAGESTSAELLAAALPLAEDEDNGYFQVIEVLAEMIQGSKEELVENSWEITITDGQIVALAD